MLLQQIDDGFLTEGSYEFDVGDTSLLRFTFTLPSGPTYTASASLCGGASSVQIANGGGSGVFSVGMYMME